MMEIINVDNALNSIIYELYQFGNLNLPSLFYKDKLKTYNGDIHEFITILHIISKLQYFIHYYDNESTKKQYQVFIRVNELAHEFMNIQCRTSIKYNNSHLSLILNEIQNANLQNIIKNDTETFFNTMKIYDKNKKKLEISKYHLLVEIQQNVKQLLNHNWKKIRLILISFRKEEKGLFYSLPYDIIKEIVNFFL
jgi:hypothetical protein